MDYWGSKQLEDRLRRLDVLAAERLLLSQIERPAARPSVIVVGWFQRLAGKIFDTRFGGLNPTPRKS